MLHKTVHFNSYVKLINFTSLAVKFEKKTCFIRPFNSINVLFYDHFKMSLNDFIGLLLLKLLSTITLTH